MKKDKFKEASQKAIAEMVKSKIKTATEKEVRWLLYNVLSKPTPADKGIRTACFKRLTELQDEEYHRKWVK